MTGAPSRIIAVTTAYHPDERLVAVVAAALRSCESVVIADNTPAGVPSASEALAGDRVRVLRPGRNVGVAAALNAALGEVPGDAEAVLLLDQDSVLAEELVSALSRHLADPTVGAAAPSPWDARSGTDFGTLTAMQAEVSDQDAVITSGMLVRRSLAQAVGGFREDLFVDYVDMDFCLRIRRTGARILQDRRLKLEHSIGDRREHKLVFLPVQVIHYPPWRHYWIARNGAILIRENARAFPSWSVKTAAYLVRWVAVTVLFESARWRCLRAFGSGVRDGLRKRINPTYVPKGAEVPIAA